MQSINHTMSTQPRHSRSASTFDASRESVLAEGVVWKQTAISDFVIKRYCRVYKDRFVTFPKRDDYSDYKTWKLDEDVQLLPAAKEDIALKHRHRRPGGTISSLASLPAISSKAEPMDLVRGLILGRWLGKRCTHMWGAVECDYMQQHDEWCMTRDAAVQGHPPPPPPTQLLLAA